ncbi:MAG: penicillin-binding protein 1C, partial [Woeseiaceae bacterium]|nr:penicillin-binding protein 1C [Woeseiaceae bacterium]
MKALRRIGRWLLWLGGCSVVVAAIAIAFCPKPDLYGDVSFSTAVYDRDGELLRLFLADDDHYRLRVSLDDVAQSAIDATLTYEDRHFYRHPGVNPAALVRGAWTTYVTRDRMMGGSTISMQVARMRFDLETTTIFGKLVQIARAIQLERHYEKDEILEAWLNLAPYGGNVEGVGTASLVYFGKPASELSLPEAFALAVIPQNPAKRLPVSGDGYLETFAARDRLLAAWIDRFGIDDETRAQFDMPLRVYSATDLPFGAPHFVQRASRSADEVVRTTLDSTLQHVVEARIDSFVERAESRGIRNASAMVIDWRTMEVLASVGSANYFDASIEGQVDGTHAKRSPGSTLKPLVYGMALDQGLIHPMTMLRDAPQRFAAYAPENFDRGFLGPVFARDALTLSRNVPAADLLYRVGTHEFYGLLEEASVGELQSPDHYGLAAVLGGIELTMEELVSLYAMLANDGVWRPLRTEHGPSTFGGQRLLSAEASFLVLDMLRDNPRPDALSLPTASGEVSIAWKTGTSFAFRDAWTVGVAGPYVIAVWVGNFDGSGNPALVGREAAAPLFFSIADAIDTDTSRPEPTPDMNLIRVDVCARTGDLPGRHCPSTTETWFIPGVSPIRVSDVHRVV